MKNWIIGGLLGACLGAWVYLACTRQPAPIGVAVQEPPAASAVPSAPPAPAVLAEVVEVIDIDPLLDPPARPVTGVPFDAEPVTAAVLTPDAPARIPPAVD